MPRPSAARMPPGRTRTRLTPAEEQSFQAWYRRWAEVSGIDPNPDHPAHRYDYRGAFKAGVEPQIDPTDGLYHWPSQFKDDDHPTRFRDGIDTRTGEPAPAQPGPGSALPEAGRWEVRETERGRWQPVDTQTGWPLPPRYLFEAPAYRSRGLAERALARRQETRELFGESEEAPAPAPTATGPAGNLPQRAGGPPGTVPLGEWLRQRLGGAMQAQAAGPGGRVPVGQLNDATSPHLIQRRGPYRSFPDPLQPSVGAPPRRSLAAGPPPTLMPGGSL